MDADSGIVLSDVMVRYGRRVALEAVTGEFLPGSMTAVVGANGAGKSTLLAAIAGAVRLASGTVRCPARSQGRLAYLPQLTAIDRDYPLTVTELIALGNWREFGAFRAAASWSLVNAAAATVGLTGRLGRRIGELSVGELQRALFARLILQDAAVILLDEPFAAVDAQTTSVLLDQIERWHQEGRTMIAVLHDLGRWRGDLPSRRRSVATWHRACTATGAGSAVLW